MREEKNMINSRISEKEYALNSAIASVEMEGYKLSQKEKDLCMDFVSNNITKEEFIKEVIERYAV